MTNLLTRTITTSRDGRPPQTSDIPVLARRSSAARWRRGATPWLLLSPVIVLMIAFIAVPVVSVFWDSLFQRKLSEPWNDGFVGLENYRRMLFDDPLFWPSLRFSAVWVVAEVGLQLVLGLIIALVVNETFRGRGAMRAIVFSPWAISGVLTTAIWILVYNPGTGVFRFLADLGIGTGTQAVLVNPDTVIPAVVVAELWRGVPFFAIMLLAELQSAPRELYEAAAVDGAGRIKRFFHVTLPHLKTAIVLTTLLRGVWEFNNVDLLLTMTNGGPADMTTTLPLYVAKLATVSHDFGYGSALTVFGFVILLIVSLVYLKLTAFQKEQD
ncbi:carbohydrate ABC transporter permease [Microbacterium sp. Marseille-Q6965]|uniref:carbohydrate ABC transporter permease n=1 Tax=Microbacterium sp. Marseille-Q6965 TaxID=2965072 RepID=UPI0021B6EB0C|nr:sugar ABC transporter permease [Microbacterium sp. Marseille-Q6965]